MKSISTDLNSSSLLEQPLVSKQGYEADDVDWRTISIFSVKAFRKSSAVRSLDGMSSKGSSSAQRRSNPG